jgi:hypothetical protein
MIEASDCEDDLYAVILLCRRLSFDGNLEPWACRNVGGSLNGFPLG